MSVLERHFTGPMLIAKNGLIFAARTHTPDSQVSAIAKLCPAQYMRQRGGDSHCWYWQYHAQQAPSKSVAQVREEGVAITVL